MRFLKGPPLAWDVRSLALLQRLSGGSFTRTRPTYGLSDSPDKASSLRAQIPVFAGHTTRLNPTTAAGTAKAPITITTGTTPSTIVSAIPAGTIRSNLATISFTVLTPPAQRLAMTAWVTRLEWHPAQNGLVAVTWTKALAHRPDTWSACSGSSRLTHLTAHQTKATLLRRPILQLTPGFVRLRKAVQPTHCKPLLKLKLRPAS